MDTKQIEDVVPVEENQQEQLTDEQKKQMDAFFEAMLKKRIRPRVQEVCHYMDVFHKKLDDLYNDLENKKCGLSALNRSFLKSFDREFINEQFPKKYL